HVIEVSRSAGPSWHGAQAWMSAATSIDQICLGLLARLLAGVPVRFVLWNGRWTLAARDTPPLADIRIADRPTLLRLVWDPDLWFGEAYCAGRIEIDGDLVGLLTAIARRFNSGTAIRTRVPRHRGGAVAARAARNARFHYDVGNDFFSRWLDARLVYTCAYFPNPEWSLDEAQDAKLEYVARKLALAPGERVFEAGCGWGALALHLAKHHGVRVTAWNVSREQLDWARIRARDAGVSDRVTFIEGDYRTMSGCCDAFVSVGMLEHVGVPQYASLRAILDRCVHPDCGRGLLHFIGRNTPTPMSRWMTRRIFPGSYIPSLSEVLEGVLESPAFSVTDVENLRLHYALTLEHWLRRYEHAFDDVVRQQGTFAARMWRMYLAQAQAGFRAGSLQLFQVSFARPAATACSWTRSRLYERPEVPA
ncbi:MAG: class I SAM-dependent methyltransferase, partial [Vicinamibacterales bacterium]